MKYTYIEVCNICHLSFINFSNTLSQEFPIVGVSKSLLQLWTNSEYFDIFLLRDSCHFNDVRIVCFVEPSFCSVDTTTPNVFVIIIDQINDRLQKDLITSRFAQSYGMNSGAIISFRKHFGGIHSHLTDVGCNLNCVWFCFFYLSQNIVHISGIPIFPIFQTCAKSNSYGRWEYAFMLASLDTDLISFSFEKI